MMMDTCNTVYGIKLCIFCACMTGAIVLSQSNICVEISITYMCRWISTLMVDLLCKWLVCCEKFIFTLF
jgi:hypothetical protein